VAARDREVERSRGRVVEMIKTKLGEAWQAGSGFSLRGSCPHVKMVGLDLAMHNAAAMLFGCKSRMSPGHHLSINV
jgi:hypothetical protein